MHERSVAAPANPTAALLREYMARDAPAREASVARFMTFAAGLSAVLALALVPLIGVPLGGSLVALLAVLTGYYFTLQRLVRRGWFHPAVTWANVAIEVSAPSLIFLLDAKNSGPEYALTAPPLVIWGTLIALSGLRGDKRLTLAAGALASLEYAALYAFVAYPSLGPDALLTLRPPLIATRVVLLFCSAVLTTIFVGHLNRRAEEALAAVRKKDVFGKYLLHERLGLGGMAEVFRATYNPEGGFQKVVAIKRVLPQYAADEAFIAMFRGEAALCSQFSHPGVVQVFDFGQFDDTYFLAMEFLDGPTLNRVIRAHLGVGLPVPAVLSLAQSLCEALQYLHERRGPDGEPMNLVHRDLNPPNILLTKLGEVKLTDFGIARWAQQAQFTEAGMIKGKPGYLAPEQATGELLDGRADLFALGVTLWECLAGQSLFAATDPMITLRNALEQPIPLISARRPDVPPKVEAFVMGLLERDVARRTRSARAALLSLRGLDPGAEGQQALVKAVRVTLETTSPSGTLAPVEGKSSSEAVTLPAAHAR